MSLTKKEQARYRAIVTQLARMSSRGWADATHPDYAPLEKELAALANKLTTDSEKKRAADKVDGYDRDDTGESPDY